ncbi:MAG: TRAP transporter small permease [Rhodobacteraceae bacterium]|nr:TRAP transporter small permease [Paracoccaceae bacterium]
MPAAIASTYRRVMAAAGYLNLGLAIIAAAVLFTVAMMIFAEVSWRYMGGRSQLWVTEVSEYSLLYITFLAAPYLLQHNRHVTVDLFLSGLGGNSARALRVVIAVLGGALCVVLTIKGVQLVLDQYAMGTRRISVMAPRSWYIFAAFPIGTGLMALQFLDQLIAAISNRRERT